MKIAIISAMKKEIEPFYDNIKDKKIKKYLDYEIHEGRIKDNDIIITFGGIAKVNTGIITTIINFLYPDIDLLINIGISGGVKGKVKAGEIVFSSKMTYCDVNATPFGYAYGQVPDMPLFYEGDLSYFEDVLEMGKVGTILSGDTFFTDLEKINSIINTHFSNDNVLALDMETAAFGQCAYIYKIPFIAIRAISDVVGDENQIGQYEDYNLIACNKICDALNKILTR